jgi:peptidoglycan/LPS O-acetylase OafA/YrhL
MLSIESVYRLLGINLPSNYNLQERNFIQNNQTNLTASQSKAEFDPRYYSLDHWRGAAALSVLVFHGFRGLKVHDSIEWLAQVASYGWLGVHLFFVISGYCIAANMSKLSRGDVGAGAFLKDRFLRIYPTYWAACMLAAVVAIASMPFNHTSLADNFSFTFGSLIGNILLIQPYLGEKEFLVVSWSLVYEVAFYVIVALGLYFFRQGVKFGILFVGALILGFLGLREWPPGIFYVLNFWHEFLFGGIVYIALYLRHNHPQRAWLMMLLPIILATTGLFFMPSFWRMVELILAAVFAVLLFILKPLDNKILSMRFLSWLQAIGVISYSLYLVHVPLSGRVVNFGLRVFPSEHPAHIIIQMVGWAVGILGAWFFYLWCERPLERLRHRLRQV